MITHSKHIKNRLGRVLCNKAVAKDACIKIITRNKTNSDHFSIFIQTEAKKRGVHPEKLLDKILFYVPIDILQNETFRALNIILSKLVSNCPRLENALFNQRFLRSLDLDRVLRFT